MHTMRTWLKELREKKHFTVQQMARALEMEPDRYYQLENERFSTNVPVLAAVRLSDLFNIPLSRLIIYEQSETNFSGWQSV